MAVAKAAAAEEEEEVVVEKAEGTALGVSSGVRTSEADLLSPVLAVPGRAASFAIASAMTCAAKSDAIPLAASAAAAATAAERTADAAACAISSSF